MTKLSKFEAYKLAKKSGAKFSKDSDQQPISVKSDLAAIAKLSVIVNQKLQVDQLVDISSIILKQRKRNMVGNKQLGIKLNGRK